MHESVNTGGASPTNSSYEQDQNQNDDWLNPPALPVTTRVSTEKFNVICGVAMTKSKALMALRLLQVTFGEMSMGMQYIEEFDLTEPLLLDEEDKWLAPENCGDNERLRSVIAFGHKNPKLRAKIMARKAVASIHIGLHEQFNIDFGTPRHPWFPGKYLPFSVWNDFGYGFDTSNYTSRFHRNEFAHNYLIRDTVDQQQFFSEVQNLYTKQMEYADILIKKLEAGIKDESAWKDNKEELSYDNRPEYGLDAPAAEEDRKDQARQKDERLSPSPLPSSSEWGRSADEEAPVLFGPCTLNESTIAWLEDTAEEFQSKDRGNLALHCASLRRSSCFVQNSEWMNDEIPILRIRG